MIDTSAAERLAAMLPRFTPTRPPTLLQFPWIFSDGPVDDHERRIVPWFCPASAPTKEPPLTLAPATPRSSTSAAPPSSPNSPCRSAFRLMNRFATARPLPSKVAVNLVLESPSGVQPEPVVQPLLLLVSA